MSLHDFRCDVCGARLNDIYVSIEIGARLGAPEHCGRRTAWIPAIGRMDAGNGPGFQAFETMDGRNQPVLIDSLKKLRQVEKESEQQFRNGEGQPMVWRRYSQDASNRDQPTLSKSYDDPAQYPTSEAAHRFKPTKMIEAPDVSYGPAVNDDNTSAFAKLIDA